MVHPFNLVKYKNNVENYKLNEITSFEKLCELEYNLLNINNKIINSPHYKIMNYKDI